MDNTMMMQFFEWDIENDGEFWHKLGASAGWLSDLGVDRVWLPPSTKGMQQDSAGYDVYDLYDLGEFDQKGTIRTKFGSKEDLIQAIEALHDQGIQVIADVVINHKAGADATELFMAQQVNDVNRLEHLGQARDIEGWTKFNFDGRKGTYSNFKWNFNHFTAVDRDEKDQVDGIFLIKGDLKEFEPEVDNENANYDYLMFADIHHHHPEVVQELDQWAQWFIGETKVDGFRMDAVKHIDFGFMKDYIDRIKASQNKDFFVVGEYLSYDIDRLTYYLDRLGDNMLLFDFALQNHFVEAARTDEHYDLSKVLFDALVSKKPGQAVTFVDNHDTQHEMYVGDWFKPLAYGLIMLRYDGYPCIFYGDYFGLKANPERSVHKEIIDQLAYARRHAAYGEQVDYFDHGNVIGWIRKGDEDHEGSGLAVVLSNGAAGVKTMSFGEGFAGITMKDVTASIEEPVVLDEEGSGTFPVKEKNLSVWIKA